MQALARRPSSLGDTEWPRKSARLGQRHFPRSEEADDHEAPTLIWTIANGWGRWCAIAFDNYRGGDAGGPIAHFLSLPRKGEVFTLGGISSGFGRHSAIETAGGGPDPGPDG